MKKPLLGHEQICANEVAGWFIDVPMVASADTMVAPVNEGAGAGAGAGTETDGPVEANTAPPTIDGGTELQAHDSVKRTDGATGLCGPTKEV